MLYPDQLQQMLGMLNQQSNPTSALGTPPGAPPVASPIPNPPPPATPAVTSPGADPLASAAVNSVLGFHPPTAASTTPALGSNGTTPPPMGAPLPPALPLSAAPPFGTPFPVTHNPALGSPVIPPVAPHGGHGGHGGHAPKPVVDPRRQSMLMGLNGGIA